MNPLKTSLPNKFCVLKFEASWCGPCKAISPYIETLKQEYPNIHVAPIDADVDPEKCQSFGVTKLPTFVFVYENKYKTIIGTDKEKLKIEFELLNKFMNQNVDQSIPEEETARVHYKR